MTVKTNMVGDCRWNIIEDLFLQVDDVERAAHTGLEAPGEQRPLKEAIRFLEERRLAAWATDLNNGAAAPLTTESVLQRDELDRNQLPEGVRPRSVGVVTQNGARQYARLWHQRWGRTTARCLCAKIFLQRGREKRRMVLCISRGDQHTVLRPLAIDFCASWLTAFESCDPSFGVRICVRFPYPDLDPEIANE